MVGVALARATSGEHDDSLLKLLSREIGKESLFAMGYFQQRFLDRGWKWLDDLLETHSATPYISKARLLRASGEPREAWKRADVLGSDVRKGYWQEFSFLGLGEGFGEVTFVARRLVEVGRSAAALDLLAMYSHRGTPDEDYAEAIAEAFEALMTRNNPDPEIHLLHSYDFEALLETLAGHREAVGTARVVRIEWFFLPALGFEPHARTLHQALAEDSAFFVEMMKILFRAASESPREDQEPSDARKQRAENAYRLLSSWSTCPGTDAAGVVDPNGLRNWVVEARKLLTEADRTDIGDEFIGQALEAAPAEPDGTWPIIAVRALLEELSNDHIEKGLEIRIYNRRGVITRDPEAGGELERSLAAKYREQEQALRDSWPRMARVLRNVADTYEAEARIEDLESERFRRGLAW
jgi:hypothetical protein